MKNVKAHSSKTRKELQEKLAKALKGAKKAKLSQAYIEASRDPARNELLQEWSLSDAADWEWKL